MLPKSDKSVGLQEYYLKLIGVSSIRGTCLVLRYFYFSPAMNVRSMRMKAPLKPVTVATAPRTESTLCEALLKASDASNGLTPHPIVVEVS